jgi:ceramide glucosyltransferase
MFEAKQKHRFNALQKLGRGKIMTIFMIFSILTAIGLVGYGLQVLAIRSHLSGSRRDLYGAENPMQGDKTSFITGGSSQDWHRRPFAPAISILKPLKGLDDNLFDNLESFCLQNYPEYEIIFSLQDQNDPAFRLAQKIQEKHPHRDITIVVEKCDYGLNPKVNNLKPAYEASKYDLILISDSNVMVDRDYLLEIVREMRDPEVGLVSNLIKGAGGRSLGSILENLHMNSFVIGSVCFMNDFLKMPCVVGKSMLMRKEALEALGGLAAVKDMLAEDYIIGERMRRLGRKVVLSGHTITNINEFWTLKKFLNRHTRWGKLRWKIGGIKYLSELLGNAVFMAHIPIMLFRPSEITISFAMVVSLLKVMGDFYVGRKIGAHQRAIHYLLCPIKDLIMGIIWFIPLVDSKVLWRGNKYRIGKGSVLYAAPS